MTERETMFLLHTLLFIMQLITTPVIFKTASVSQSSCSSMAMVMGTNHSQLRLNKHTSTVCNIWDSHSSADEGSVLLGHYNVSTWCLEWALCPPSPSAPNSPSRQFRFCLTCMMKALRSSRCHKLFTSCHDVAPHNPYIPMTLQYFTLHLPASIMNTILGKPITVSSLDSLNMTGAECLSVTCTSLVVGR